MNGDDDPGWLPALRPWWHLVVPFVPMWLRRFPLNLVGLRHLFIHSGVAIVELSVVLGWTQDAGSGQIPPLAWLIVAVLALWSTGGLAWTERRPLPTGSAEELAGAFRARSFIELGLALAPALWGIAGAEVLDRSELIWIGTFVSVALLSWTAPRRSRLDRIDEDLRAAGSPLMIRHVLDATA